MSTLVRQAFITGFALAFLAGCGAAQPPSGVPRGLAESHRHGRCCQDTDLLYAAGDRYGFIYTYQTGRWVGTFKLRIQDQKAYANGLCADSSGNVFITLYSASFTKVVEYAHAGTQLAELKVPQPTAVACASDPTSGNLAVTASFPTEGLESVAIFTGARGKPALYYGIPKMDVYAFCAYDNAGNLFVDGVRHYSGFALAELQKGSQRFTAITVKGIETSYPGNLQWVGKYLTVAVPRVQKIYVLHVSGTTATVARTIVLDGWKTRTTPQSWIQGDNIIAPAGTPSTNVAFWKYPQGGKPFKVLSGFGGYAVYGAAVSLAPGH